MRDGHALDLQSSDDCEDAGAGIRRAIREIL